MHIVNPKTQYGCHYSMSYLKQRNLWQFLQCTSTLSSAQASQFDDASTGNNNNSNKINSIKLLIVDFVAG